MNLSRNTRRAVSAYGLMACLEAARMHLIDGEGASTVAFQCNRTITTTRQADAAINAGIEIRREVTVAYVDAIAYDPNDVRALPAYSRNTFANDSELREAVAQRRY